jgi:8-oxo-dGTP pyrophosphatase MutT (NUDIX family)
MTKTTKAVLAIIHDKDSFLILKKQGAWTGWQFVQGAIDEGETPEQAISREVTEETGLKTISIEKKLDIKTEYWFIWEGEKIHKYIEFFLIKADKNEPITLSIEHSEFKWCDYKEVLKQIKYNKKEFEKAYKEMSLSK